MKKVFCFFALFFFIFRASAFDLSAEHFHVISDSEGSSDSYSIAFKHNVLDVSEVNVNLFKLESDIHYADSIFTGGNVKYSFNTPYLKMNFKLFFADSEKTTLTVPALKKIIDLYKKANLKKTVEKLENGMNLVFKDFSANAYEFEFPFDVYVFRITPYIMMADVSCKDMNLYVTKKSLDTGTAGSYGLRFNYFNLYADFSYSNAAIFLRNSLNEVFFTGNASLFSAGTGYKVDFSKIHSSADFKLNYIFANETFSGTEYIDELGLRFILSKAGYVLSKIDIDQKLKCSLLNEAIYWNSEFSWFSFTADIKNFFLISLYDDFFVKDNALSENNSFINLKNENEVSKQLLYSGLLIADINGTVFLNKGKNISMNINKYFLLPYRFKKSSGKSSEGSSDSITDEYISGKDILLSGLSVNFKISF